MNTKITTQEARTRIILLSIATTTICSAFLIIGPSFLPLRSSQALQLVQIVFPVFSGYLGAAVLFLFRGNPNRGVAVDDGLLFWMTYSPFFIFWVIGGAVFIEFLVSNLPGRPEGMSFPDLATYLTLLISFMNAVIGALISFLFQTEEIASAKADAAQDNHKPATGA